MRKSLRNKVYGYFISRWGAFEYKRDWMKIPVCPFCGGEEKLGVNLNKNFVHCFKCEFKGDVFKFMQEADGLTFKEAINVLNVYEGYSYTPPPIKLLKPIPVVLPDGYMGIARGETSIGKLARKYLINRKFSIEYLSKRGIGYVSDIDKELFGYIIIPFYSKRKVVYYQTRRFIGVGPKYKNPAKEDFGIGKNNLIYNIDSLSKYNEINIFEGAFNALTVGNNSIAIQGKVLSRWQEAKLLKSKVELFNICLDGDAVSYALDLGSRILPYKKVRIVIFPEDQDANDLGKSVTIGLIKKTPVLNNFLDLIKDKNERIYRTS